MDTLSHGLWGGILFGRDSRRDFKLAMMAGMGADLCSFGPYFVTHLPLIVHRWAQHRRMEPPPIHTIPPFGSPRASFAK